MQKLNLISARECCACLLVGYTVSVSDVSVIALVWVRDGLLTIDILHISMMYLYDRFALCEVAMI